MTQVSSLARSICYHYPYVAPAALLSADPDLIRTHGYTVVLSAAQLVQALPWDRRVQSKAA